MKITTIKNIKHLSRNELCVISGGGSCVCIKNNAKTDADLSEVMTLEHKQCRYKCCNLLGTKIWIC